MVRTVALLLLFLAGFCQVPTALARHASPLGANGQGPSVSGNAARIQKLRMALDQESTRSIYQWHNADQPTWFDKLLRRIGDGIQHAWDAFWKFMRKLWPASLAPSAGMEGRGKWNLKELRLWLVLIGVATVAGAGVLLWLRRRRESPQLSIPVTVVDSLPDLSEGALASARSEDEWFQLASQLEQKGELRLALRAAYFGLLAGLGQREWLAIRRDRTNREYLDEFTRRWRRRPQAAVDARAEVPEKLRGSFRQFDGVWYGLHIVTQESVALYCRQQRELLNHV